MSWHYGKSAAQIAVAVSSSVRIVIVAAIRYL
jgi:hypothetical protein